MPACLWKLHIREDKRNDFFGCGISNKNQYVYPEKEEYEISFAKVKLLS